MRGRDDLHAAVLPVGVIDRQPGRDGLGRRERPVTGVLVAALISSLNSSLNSALNSVATVTTRDFALHFRPDMSEKSQVLVGRVAIVVCTIFGIGATYMVYKAEEGVYRYFQALGATIFPAVTPAILFGILSRRVTTKGAFVSFLFGCVVSGIYLTDTWMDPDTAERVFPWLHLTLTEAYSYRGLWGFILVTIVLFTVSAMTQKDPPEKLERTTVDWSRKREAFAGISDWRLHFALLTVLTIAIYAWLW